MGNAHRMGYISHGWPKYSLSQNLDKRMHTMHELVIDIKLRRMMIVLKSTKKQTFVVVVLIPEKVV